MVQFLSIFFFLGFLQFLLGFSKVPFFCVTLYIDRFYTLYGSIKTVTLTNRECRSIKEGSPQFKT